MSTKFGVLGRASLASTPPIQPGVYRLYTVPAGRFAKGKLRFRAKRNSSVGVGVFRIDYNEVEIFSSGVNAGLNNFTVGTDRVLCVNNAVDPTGVSNNTTIAPSGATYILGQNDRFNILPSGLPFESWEAEFVGIEDDIKQPSGARRGVLGRNSSTTAGTHTVYVVPKGRTAIGHIFLSGLVSNGAGTVSIDINGITVATKSGNPVVAISCQAQGSILGSSTGGTTPQTTCTYSDVQFKLSEGDLVSYTLTGDFFVNGFFGIPVNDFIQFVGSEYPLP